MSTLRAPDQRIIGDPWMYHMRRGDFAPAWAVCDDVLRSRAGAPCSHWPRHLQYVWDGRSLAGKRVLIRCYHGLGDTVQFIRFAPWVKRIAREVIVWAQPALLPILQTARGIDRLLPLHDGTPEVDYDVDVESMELAHIFRVTLETLPAAVPYLFPPPAVVPRFSSSDRRLHVGLVWSCGSADETRWIPFPFVRPLLDTPGVCWHVLQRGPPRKEWPVERGGLDGSDDIVATATRVRALDLVISVDSFPVHLAGALAVPVWVLLHHRADWRWMNERGDSPWYPTARLFRPPRPDDWTSVIDRVGRELRRLHEVQFASGDMLTRPGSRPPACAR